jgi:hypothetical protein
VVEAGGGQVIVGRQPIGHNNRSRIHIVADKRFYVFGIGSGYAPESNPSKLRCPSPSTATNQGFPCCPTAPCTALAASDVGFVHLNPSA